MLSDEMHTQGSHNINLQQFIEPRESLLRAKSGYKFLLKASNGKYCVSGSGKMIICDSETGYVWTVRVLNTYGSEVNIAGGKTATQSSDADAGVASRAVDGDTNGIFSGNSCTHTSTENNPWWEVSLGGVYEVTKVTLFNRGDNSGDRLSDVAITVDGKSCGFISAAVSLGGSGSVTCYLTGSSVKVALQKTQEILTLCEVQVAGTKVPEVGIHGEDGFCSDTPSG